MVAYNSEYTPGTVVVDTNARFLYLVLSGNRAMRYGIGVARSGFEWSGTHKITAKREWPGWTPPAEMRQREPHLPAYMPGGSIIRWVHERFISAIRFIDCMAQRSLGR